MNDPVIISPYNPEWPFVFTNEAVRIKAALGDNCIVVNHVGSTAIPGMCAKPIIDMIPVVRNIMDVDQAKDAMVALGYTPRGEAGMLFRRFFTKKGFNIHVYQADSGELDRLLKFRDWMRTHPEDAKAYADLKMRLAKEFFSERFLYTMGKENFIAEIDIKSGFDGVRIVEALTNREWEAYHRIRKEQIFDLLHEQYDRHHPSLKDSARVNLVIYKGAEIVGVAQLQFLTDTEAALRPFAIDAPYQHAGIGSIFLAAIEKWLAQQGCRLIRLHAYPKALNFYLRHGYLPMPFPEKQSLAGIEAIDLGKKI